MKPLAKRQEITIYHDPLTAKKPEGKATLVKQIEDRAYVHKEEYQVWKVQFEGQDEPVNRIVAPQHLTANELEPA